MFTKKDVASIAGSIAGSLAYAAVTVTVVIAVDKIKERRAKKTAEPKEDIITGIMREAQK